MDLVSVVVVGAVLVFTCLALYELFGRSKNDKKNESRHEAGQSRSGYENTELVADDLPPTQTGVYKVKHMLASTKRQTGEGKFETRKDAVDEEVVREIEREEAEEQLPDPFS